MRPFDQGEDPSIRHLAKELAVTPSAIHHHFDSRAEIVRAAVDIVWREILPSSTTTAVGDIYSADPVDVLLVAGIEIKRGFARHYKVAPYMAATPESDKLAAGILAIMANLFARFRLSGESAAEAFHAWSCYLFEAALFGANRLAADAELKHPRFGPDRLEYLRNDLPSDAAGLSSEQTRVAVDSVIDISVTDPERDEKLFGRGLRRLLDSLRDI